MPVHTWPVSNPYSALKDSLAGSPVAAGAAGSSVGALLSGSVGLAAVDWESRSPRVLGLGVRIIVAVGAVTIATPVAAAIKSTAAPRIRPTLRPCVSAGRSHQIRPGRPGRRAATGVAADRSRLCPVGTGPSAVRRGSGAAVEDPAAAGPVGDSPVAGTAAEAGTAAAAPVGRAAVGRATGVAAAGVAGVAGVASGDAAAAARRFESGRRRSVEGCSPTWCPRSEGGPLGQVPTPTGARQTRISQRSVTPDATSSAGPVSRIRLSSVQVTFNSPPGTSTR